MARLMVEIQKSITAHGSCHIVIPGGRSPVRVLKLLREKNIPWQRIHLYPSDERCLPIGDINRNDTMIQKLILLKSLLPIKNFHSIPAELGPLEGALRYQLVLQNLPKFDIVLLGAGSDGHTASLFPGEVSFLDNRSVIPVYNAPKPPPNRVSIGMVRLLEARERWIIISGTEKGGLIERIHLGEDLPITRIKPTAWFVEQTLWGNKNKLRYYF